MADEITFAQDIRPLFRNRDVRSLSFAYHLSSYHDVRTNAQERSTQPALHVRRPQRSIATSDLRQHRQLHSDNRGHKHSGAQRDRRLRPARLSGLPR